MLRRRPWPSQQPQAEASALCISRAENLGLGRHHLPQACTVTSGGESWVPSWDWVPLTAERGCWTPCGWRALPGAGGGGAADCDWIQGGYVAEPEADSGSRVLHRRGPEGPLEPSVGSRFGDALLPWACAEYRTALAGPGGPWGWASGQTRQVNSWKDASLGRTLKSFIFVLAF